MPTKRDFLENGSIIMTEREIPKRKCHKSLKVGCLPYAAGKQPFITMINHQNRGFVYNSEIFQQVLKVLQIVNMSVQVSSSMDVIDDDDDDYKLIMLII